MIKKHECHPSTINMKENIQISTPLKFVKVTCMEIEKEAKTYDNKKHGTFSNIPFKKLKETSRICNSYLLNF